MGSMGSAKPVYFWNHKIKHANVAHSLTKPQQNQWIEILKTPLNGNSNIHFLNNLVNKSHKLKRLHLFAPKKLLMQIVE